EGRMKHGKDDEEQQDAVEEHEPTIDFSDVVEHVVMVHPHDEDADETRHKGEERGPLVEEALRQRDGGRRWVPKVQREQGDRKREYAVTESLHPDGFLLLGCLAVHDVP